MTFFYIYFFSAPPEITVEKSWVHAGEGSDVELVCVVHGDVTSDVSYYYMYYLLKVLLRSGERESVRKRKRGSQKHFIIKIS